MLLNSTASFYRGSHKRMNEWTQCLSKLKKLNTIGNKRRWAKAGAIQKIFGKYDDGRGCKQFLIRVCFGLVVINSKQCAL
jgi:hypothetical protein